MLRIFRQIEDIKKNSLIGYNFTEEQHNIISCFEGNILVNASAGSGKTTTTIARIYNLIGKGIPENKILFITFSKKATEDMRTKINEFIGNNKVEISTIHSLSFKYLKKFTNKNYKVIQGIEIFNIFRKIVSEHLSKKIFLDTGLSEIISAYSYVRNVGLTKEEMYTYFKNNFIEIDLDSIFKLFLLYETYKIENDIVDFDDMTLRLCNLIENNETYKFDIISSYDRIMIDEAQDCNFIQHKLIEYITTNNTMLIGDICQSIYAFRGAAINLFVDFATKYNAKIFKLTKNFRSSHEIVGVSNMVISNAKFIPDYLKYEMSSATGISGNKVNIIKVPNTKIQAEFVAKDIYEKIQKGNVLNDIVVLSRLNYSLFFIQKYLLLYKIPFKGCKNLFKTKELDFLILCLKIWDSLFKKEKIAFNIFVPFLKNIERISVLQIEKLYKEYLEKDDISIKFLLEKDKKFENLLIVYNIISNFEMQVLDKYTLLFDYIRKVKLPKYYKYVYSLELALENLNILEEFVKYYSTYEHNVQYLLNDIRYIINNDNPNGISLSTIHGAKGLEWDVVYLIDVVEDILPHKRGDFDEELRIFYVGITRPKSVLNIISPAICKYPRNQSQFLKYINKNKNFVNEFLIK